MNDAPQFRPLNPSSRRRRATWYRRLALSCCLLGGLWQTSASGADEPFGAADRSARGTYQPPQLPARPQSRSNADNGAAVTRQTPPQPAADLSDYADETTDTLVPPVVTVGYQADAPESSSVLQPVQPHAGKTVEMHETHVGPHTTYEGTHTHGSHTEAWSHNAGCDCGTCDGLAACDAPGNCDALPGRYGPLGGLSGLSRWSFNDWNNVGCDSGACDSLGCGDCGTCYSCTRIGLLPLSAILHERWFGGAEWVLWVRRGNEFPVVAVDPTGGANTPLFGGNGRYGEDGVSGGRFTVGLWLDNCRRQSLVARMWGTGTEDLGANFSAANVNALSIPFTDQNNTPQLFDIINGDPAAANEFMNITYESEAYGADVSLRNLWVSGLGGRIEFLYGYQFFRLNEAFDMNSRAVLPPPADTTDLVTDRFDVANEFHGGQLGLHMNYREGRWMFDGLFKLGLGNLRRTADLSFSGTRNGTPIEAGYLVNSANAGAGSTDSFAVMPEIGLKLGYCVNRYTDFTIGYSYLSVSDVLQVSDTINTVVDTSDTPTAPTRNFTHGDYWLHGVNIGLTFNY